MIICVPGEKRTMSDSDGETVSGIRIGAKRLKSSRLVFVIMYIKRHYHQLYDRYKATCRSVIILLWQYNIG